MKYAYYILKDSYCKDIVSIKTTLSKKQFSDAVAYIALNFHDIVPKKLYCPKIVAIFLDKYYPCELINTKEIKKHNHNIPEIDVCVEKNKHLINSYYFRESYAKKNHKQFIKEAIFEYIALKSIHN